MTLVSMDFMVIRLAAEGRRPNVRNATVVETLIRMLYRTVIQIREIVLNVFITPEMVPRINVSFVRSVTMVMPRHTRSPDANVSESYALHAFFTLFLKISMFSGFFISHQLFSLQHVTVMKTGHTSHPRHRGTHLYHAMRMANVFAVGT